MAIPAVLCIDVEPDERIIAMPDPEPRLHGLEALLPASERIRATLGAPTGETCALTWFLRMDPQIELAYGSARFIGARYGAELAALAARGDELAVHAHSYRWEEPAGWVQDQASAEHVAHCAITSLTAYADTFGAPCRAYRHGDRFMSASLASVLVDHGVRVDLTLEPGAPEVAGLVATENNRGVLPSTPRDLAAPYFADPADVLAPSPPRGDGTDHLLIVPLTGSVRLASPMADGPVPTGTMLPWAPPREFAAMLEARLTDPGLTHLAFTIRSDLPLHRREWEWFNANVALLGEHPVARDLVWVTASQARTMLAPAATAPRRWPEDDRAARAAVAALAASLSAGVRDVELELDEERARRAHETAGLTADLHRVEARRVELEMAAASQEAERRASDAARQELAEIRATTWWRAHERLAPILRRLPGRR